MESLYKGVAVLVTGGAGFIGSHVTEQLVRYGAHVTVLDNLATGQLSNIEHLLKDITYIEGDISDMATCVAATENKQIIFHVAAFISVPLSVSDPLTCHRVNVDGTHNLLEAAHLNGVERFVFSSSAAVYGTRSEAVSEDIEPRPESPYAYSKLIGEAYCKEYASLYNINTVCLRYFNVYGERQKPEGAVVAVFEDRMTHNKPITFFGDGSQTRDFVPVKEVVNANLKLAWLPADQMNGQAFNIATGTSISLLELFKNLKKRYPAYQHEPLFEPARAGDIDHSAAVCIKLKRTLELFD